MNKYAVFVAENGKSDAPGTREEPVNSISAALKIAGQRPRIYVCKGTYAEKVEIIAPIAIYGGFECGTWTEPSERPQVAAPLAGDYALRIRGVTGKVLISRIEFAAQPGDPQKSRSSIASFVSDSPQVALRGVKLVAKDALDGSNASPGATGTLLAPETSVNGNNPEVAGVGKGGLAKTCACSSGGTSKGGRGGDLTGTIDGAAGEKKMATSDPITSTGDPSTQAECNATGTPGRFGSNAPAGADAPAPNSIGAVTADGWKPSDGSAGQPGNPGQGGGGAGSKSAGASPGGGGGGGCGATGGGGGNAGGSSIALLAINAPITLEPSELVAGKAGRGGDGAIGGPGDVGGSGGGRIGSCSGGDGGKGGNGGAGAGGSGGISGGIVHKNGAPTTDGATDASITFKAAGVKGTGGKSPTNDGKAGDAKAILPL